MKLVIASFLVILSFNSAQADVIKNKTIELNQLSFSLDTVLGYPTRTSAVQVKPPVSNRYFVTLKECKSAVKGAVRHLGKHFAIYGSYCSEYVDSATGSILGYSGSVYYLY